MAGPDRRRPRAARARREPGHRVGGQHRVQHAERDRRLERAGAHPIHPRQRHGTGRRDGGRGTRLGGEHRQRHGDAISEHSGAVLGDPIRVGLHPDAIAYGAGSVWVANLLEASVTRIDARTGHVLAGQSPSAASRVRSSSRTDRCGSRTSAMTRSAASTPHRAQGPIAVGRAPWPGELARRDGGRFGRRHPHGSPYVSRRSRRCADEPADAACPRPLGSPPRGAARGLRRVRAASPARL